MIEAERIMTNEKNMRIFEEIGGIADKAELAGVLAEELAKFTIYDVMRIRAWQDREINMLPSPYREKARPYFIEWHVGRYTKVMAMLSDGGFKDLKGPVKDSSLFREFCATESKRMKEHEDDDDDPMYGRSGGLYYLLVSCFYMFVLDEPGHPIGTPFPGGFTVRQDGAAYYCPIRDKEKDVWYSICNFCPCKQDEKNK